MFLMCFFMWECRIYIYIYIRLLYIYIYIHIPILHMGRCFDDVSYLFFFFFFFFYVGMSYIYIHMSIVYIYTYTYTTYVCTYILIYIGHTLGLHQDTDNLYTSGDHHTSIFGSGAGPFFSIHVKV